MIWDKESIQEALPTGKINFSKEGVSRSNELNVQNGDTFLNRNFTQIHPHTEILQGISGLKFIGCNLVNCKLPVDATKDDCLHFQKSNCGNIHPKWGLDCTEDCEHVIESEDITIDGVVIDTIYTHKDTML